MKPQDAVIRNFKPEDRDSIIEICYQTGFGGKSVKGRFSDKKLFALVFALDYTENEPENCFVAERNGKVLGYCVGTMDTLRQERRYFRRQIPKVALQVLTHTFWRHPEDAYRVLTWFIRKLSGQFEDSPKLTRRYYEKYPAHAHMDLLEEARSLGIGQRLLSRLVDKARKEGLQGFHFLTFSNNHAVQPFCQKMGFKELAREPGDLWNLRDGTHIVRYCMDI